MERQTAEHKYAHILETALAGFWISDLAGKIVEVNDAYCRMSGYSRAELLCMNIADVEAKESAADVLNHIQALRQTKRESFVSRHRRKDGTLFDVEINATLLDGREEQAVIFVQDITARLTAEQALRASEDKARHTLAAAPIGIYELAFDGSRFLNVNDTVCQVTGYSREELFAMNPLDLTDEAGQMRLRERMRQKLAGDQVAESVEYQVRTKDGRTVDLALNVGAFVYENGKPQSVLVVARDVTAPKQIEEQTREHMRGLEFLSQIGLELLRQNPETDMLQFVGERVWSFVQDALVVVNSYDPSQNQTTVRGLFCRPEERERLVQLFGGDPVGLALTVTPKYRAMMTPGKLNPVPGGLYSLCFEQIPEPLCRQLEADFEISCIHAAVFSLGEELVGTLAILSRRPEPLPYAAVVETFLNQAAVSVQRWYAEQSLRESEKRYRQIVETAREGIFVLNAQAVISYVNQRAATMFGYTPEEMIGRAAMDLIVYPEERDRVGARWRRRQDGLSDFVAEFRYRRKDGSPLWAMLSASPLRDPAGKFMGTLALMSDITERKRAQAAAQRSGDRSQLLSQITARLLGAENPQAIVDELCTAVMNHLECQTFFNFLLDAPSGRLHLNACAGIPKESVRQIEWLDLGVAVCGCVAQSGERIIAEDIQNTPDVRTDLIRSFGIQAYACHPLLAQGKVLGTLSFGTRTRTAFTTDEVDMMKTVTDQVAIAIQRIRSEQGLRESEERARRQNAVLQGINQIFQQALNCRTEQELGSVCLTVAEQLTGSQFGFIGELNAEGRLDDIAISDPGWAACRMEQRIGHRLVPGGFMVHGIYGRVFNDGKGFYTNDPSTHPDRIGTPQGHPGLTSFLGVPLKQEGKIIGMIGVANRAGGYHEADLVCLESVAPAMVQVFFRLRAEQALRQRKEDLEAARTGLENEKRWLEAVMEALPVGLATFDSRGGDLQANSAYEETWGSPRPVVQSVDDYGPYKAWWVDSGRPIKPEEWASAQAVQKGVSVIGQFLEIQRFDGSHAFVVNSGSPVRDARGNIIGCVIAIQDVTPLKRAEERIQKLNRDTEQRAQELEVANEELERLATSLAYDLRSPLVSIHSVAQTIAQDYGAALPPQALELFKLIHANAQEMEQLTQGLLRLMRVTRQPLHRQAIAPGEMVHALWRDLEPEYAGRQVEIEIRDLPECTADPLLLKEVWKELLLNALKFTRVRAHARIEIGSTLNPVLTRQLGMNGDGGCTYYVRDNGVGFEMSYAGRIFRPFQRYHHPEEFGGAGVGLAIVERIIRRHGGRVWAEGTLDHGATVYFTL